jgi:hypothetical protein
MELDLDLDDPLAAVGSSKKRHRRLSRRAVVKLSIAASCCTVLIVFLVHAVQSAREAARRSQCLCNLCQITLALHNYQSATGSFPPAYIADASGKPMHSWRVLILPYLEQQDLYAQYKFTEPWDGPNNIQLLNRMPATFACPSWHDHRESPTTLTSYVGMTGPGTFFPGSASIKLEDVTDGAANTLMVVEVTNVEIPWTAPQDLDVRTMSFRINDPKRPGISSKHPGGANVSLADTGKRFLFESITPEALKALTTIAGGEGITVDQTLSEK